MDTMKRGIVKVFFLGDETRRPITACESPKLEIMRRLLRTNTAHAVAPLHFNKDHQATKRS